MTVQFLYDLRKVSLRTVPFFAERNRWVIVKNVNTNVVA